MNRRSFFTALAAPAVAPLIPKAKALPDEPPKAKCGPPTHATGYTPYTISYTAPRVPFHHSELHSTWPVQQGDTLSKDGLLWICIGWDEFGNPTWERL